MVTESAKEAEKYIFVCAYTLKAASIHRDPAFGRSRSPGLCYAFLVSSESDDQAGASSLHSATRKRHLICVSRNAINSFGWGLGHLKNVFVVQFVHRSWIMNVTHIWPDSSSSSFRLVVVNGLLLQIIIIGVRFSSLALRMRVADSTPSCGCCVCCIYFIRLFEHTAFVRGTRAPVFFNKFYIYMQIETAFSRFMYTNLCTRKCCPARADPGICCTWG